MSWNMPKTDKRLSYKFRLQYGYVVRAQRVSWITRVVETNKQTNKQSET